ncbi:transcriptional regulator [Secundilactobacillus silagincola]|uniref:Transcriptional regulator n=1 Tax=Secundilactobacillus silagincola TaxID=1714681 RepID=A0A1Z5J265_9LACO|nr:transcriptional regulator [Secundilactobacillus silagincola]
MQVDKRDDSIQNDDNSEWHSKVKERIAGEMLWLFQKNYFTLSDIVDYFHEDPKSVQRTVQRDLRAIRNSMDSLPDAGYYTVNYDKAIPGYHLFYKLDDPDFQKDQEIDSLHVDEALAIMKILIGTRALEKGSVNTIEKHLKYNLTPKQQAFLTQETTETLSKYYPVKTVPDLIDRVRIFTDWIEQKATIKFTYQSSVPNSSTTKKRRGVPLSLYFSEYYFYVLLYDDEHEQSRIYRLDRFITFRKTNSGKVTVPRIKKLDVGELRKKTYLLSGGGDTTLEFWYRGFPQTALDRFPESSVKKTRTLEDGSQEVFIKCRNVAKQGAKLWLMSQGSLVSGVKPEYLRGEVREEIQKMMANYE